MNSIVNKWRGYFMKKVNKFIIELTIVMLFCLVGCSNNKMTNNIVISQTMSFIPEATDADLSGYSNLHLKYDDDGNVILPFKEITADMLAHAVGDEYNNSIIYIGYADCHNCQSSIQGLYDAAVELGQNVYYINCKTAFTTDSDYFTAVNAVKEILTPEEDDDGNVIYLPEYQKDDNGKYIVDEKGDYVEVTDENGNTIYSNEIEYNIYTPLIFQIKDGRINKENYIIGYDENNDYLSVCYLGAKVTYYDDSGKETSSTFVESYKYFLLLK